MYSVNFTVTEKKLCLRLHYNGANSYLLVNGAEIIKFEAKDSEIVATLSKDWSVDNMKKAGFNPITVDDILDIHKYLMKKNNMI